MVPTEQSGRAISDMHAMGGEHQTPETLGVRTVLNGTVPAAAAGDYALEVAAYTGGRGHFTCRFSGYRPCENAKNITEELGYSPEADLANTPDSVFCAHGAGFTVKWNEVPLYMHLPSVLNGTGKLNRSRASVPSPSVSIDEQELEAIMEREFGPIRRKQYTSPTVNGKAVQDIRFVPRRERLIVDGYNLIFAWTELKALAAEDLSAARDKLIDMLLSYSSYTNRETVLVFDAYKVPGGIGERSNSETLHVLYTRENESADLYIERLADEIGKDELVRVVTSDSLIRLTALRAGVLRTSAAEFIAEVQDALYAQSPALATDWYYAFSQDTNYIRRDRIAKDVKWLYDGEYGTLEVTINLSKPEKDPKAIAAARNAPQTGYPLCQLCQENEGYAGRINHPARQNHRLIPLTINGSSWFFQYSPYVYYNEHCILLNSEHIPMKIDEACH